MIAPKNIDRVLDALTVNQEELYYHILYHLNHSTS